MIKFERVSYQTFRDYYLKHITNEEAVIAEAYKSIKLPQRSTKHSAGYDFYVNAPINGDYGNVYPTGIKACMPENVVLMIYPRSSLGFKYDFTLDNTVGVIDSDYYNNPQNEGHILISWTAKEPIRLNTGDKLCQGIFTNFLITDDDRATETRTGGIGSTGK